MVFFESKCTWSFLKYCPAVLALPLSTTNRLLLSDLSDAEVLRMLMTSRISALVAAVRRIVPLRPRRVAAAHVVDAHPRSAWDTRHSSHCARCDRPGYYEKNCTSTGGGVFLLMMMN